MAEAQLVVKPWYLSKTLWTNAILGVLALAVPWVKENITSDLLAYIFMGANGLLRLITKDKISLW